MPLDELVAMLARRPAPQGEFRRLQPMRPADAQPPL
jgi:hypothetical protein